ncbi:MAG: monofunctional biosynthetic peptidoglycan transglycosylase [Pseudomonadota bacterium]|nr:monofunctional biosynthetic peptidoglycan transglycosylase [Pseudomonadota bacterium]
MSRRRRAPTKTKKTSLLWRLLKRSVQLLLLILLLDAAYLWWLMPDWDKLAKGPVPKSAFIKEYEAQRSDNTKLPKLRWQPVALSAIAKPMRRAVVVAEDSRFYEHEGFDVAALQDAWEYNLERRKFAIGGSTLSQQLAKNLFLTPSRNPLRKWHEVWLTAIMERQLSKRRILELYLNVAEFGPGIYGVEAASRKYWGISARQLSTGQAIELAATLPGPKKHNPATRTKFFNNKVKKIGRHMRVGAVAAPVLTPAKEVVTGTAPVAESAPASEQIQ